MAPHQELLSRASYPQQPPVNIAAGEDARSDSSSANNRKIPGLSSETGTHYFILFFYIFCCFSQESTSQLRNRESKSYDFSHLF